MVFLVGGLDIEKRIVQYSKCPNISSTLFHSFFFPNFCFYAVASYTMLNGNSGSTLFAYAILSETLV